MEIKQKTLLDRVRINESTISTLLGMAVIVVVGILIFNYFKGVQPTEEIPVETKTTPVEELADGEVPESLPVTHTVVAGESLWTVAEKYYGSGYNWVDIAAENELANPNLIEKGQALSIPKAAVKKPEQRTAFGPVIQDKEYAVQKGDHLWGIAVRAYQDGYRWPEIAAANQIANPDIIEPGTVLVLP